MKKYLLILLLIVLTVSAYLVFSKGYYYSYDSKCNLEFLHFFNGRCYNATPSTITIKNKKFIGFGGYHYFDISTYTYKKSTNTYYVDILVDRDPSTDKEICNKCPYDRGNITHIIFSIVYSPSKKTFNAKYKGFVSSEDIIEYENGKPMYINTNYIDIYYDSNPKLIKELNEYLNYFNKKAIKEFGKDGEPYDIEIVYLIKHCI